MRPDIKPLLIKYHEVLKNNEYEQYITLPNYYTSKNNSQKKSIFKRLKHKLFKNKASLHKYTYQSTLINEIKISINPTATVKT